MIPARLYTNLTGFCCCLSSNGYGRQKGRADAQRRVLILSFHYVSVLIFPSFHIKYSSEASCRRCVLSRVIRAETEIKRCAKSDNITFGITRKHKKLKQMKAIFEALWAFKTPTACTCRFRAG